MEKKERFYKKEGSTEVLEEQTNILQNKLIGMKPPRL